MKQGLVWLVVVALMVAAFWYISVKKNVPPPTPPPRAMMFDPIVATLESGNRVVFESMESDLIEYFLDASGNPVHRITPASDGITLPEPGDTTAKVTATELYSEDSWDLTLVKMNGALLASSSTEVGYLVRDARGMLRFRRCPPAP